ncbi:MAG: GNAT family N-acetyltransferase [Thiovulaceae bacterium]|nr:GNAT family N-acetyltransferase [Sulfurimonadaceae bacterium]
MQIREIQLTELTIAYEIIKQYMKHLSYNEYEDLIYQMVKENYKIILLLDEEKAITYAGIKIETTLSEKRHIHIYELMTDQNKDKNYYENQMLSYLVDYAKINMCNNITCKQDYNKQISR